MPKRLTALGFAFRRFAVPGRVGARVFGLNIGCRYSTPVRKRPLHPTRSQFKPEASQTQAPVTPATEPERRAGGSLTTTSPIPTRSCCARNRRRRQAPAESQCGSVGFEGLRKERLDDALMQEPPAKGAAAAAAKVGRQFGVHSADFEQRAEVAWRGRRRSPARKAGRGQPEAPCPLDVHDSDGEQPILLINLKGLSL